jgi:sialic acid synthase SpsE
MKKIQITEKRAIGNDEPPFIIAEIGNNHNGDIKIAKQLIMKAKGIGVDAVKFQKKDIETAFPKELLDRSYKNSNSYGNTYREHKEILELSEEQLLELRKLSNDLGIFFFATPFDNESVDVLERLNVPLYKISSFHLTKLDLIEYVCQKGKPIILSTGMSTLEEIDEAVELIRQYTENFVLLQCTSSYPADHKDINLKVIQTLNKRYKCLVGYSGHERGVLISAGAVLLGACVIERHFTLDRTMKGPDHAASLEPEGMSLLVRRSRNFYISLGFSEKKVLESEVANRKKFRNC